MALIAFLSSFIRLTELIEYSSLYKFGILFHSYYLSTDFTLYSNQYSHVTSFPDRCIGVGLVSDYSDALCRLQGCRVVFSNVSAVLRLLDTINRGYILRMRGGPLMVTAQYGCPLHVYIILSAISWGGYSSVFSPGWMARTGCRKELSNQG